MLEKTLNNYNNQQKNIKTQLNELNSMEDNMNNLNIFQDSIEVGKQIGIKPEDLMVLLLILKDKVKIIIILMI